jgi:hypothetical protein
MSGAVLGFVDVRFTPDGFRLPLLKWRELLFIGALRAEGDREAETPAATRPARWGVSSGPVVATCEAGRYVRDPSRPMPPFAAGDIFPVGASFLATVRDEWVEISVSAASSGCPGEQEA